MAFRFTSLTYPTQTVSYTCLFQNIFMASGFNEGLVEHGSTEVLELPSLDDSNEEHVALRKEISSNMVTQLWKLLGYSEELMEELMRDNT